ncbi:MAG: PQQ-like beta-propeller repeat protein, partial [bacterium]|nr:PQQ-like beta-propeller repeat protein [bacterium]
MRILNHIPILILLALPALAQDWPQFRGNNQLTGVATSPVPDNLKLLWTYEAEDAFDSSAAIVGGTVYAGNFSGKLLAIDLATGKLRWSYDAKEPIGESSPTVHNGIVYIGDLLGVVHAVRASDGKPVWTYQTESEIKSSAVVTGGKVLIGSYDEHLYALDAATGKLVWRFQTLGPVHATPGTYDGITYVAGCDENFRAIRVADGREIYYIESGAYTGASPALVDGKAYYGTFNNEVLGVNLTARDIMWVYEHPKRHFPFYSSAAVLGDRVVVGGRDKMVHCLNTKTGEPHWTYMTRARVESSPVIAGNRVYVGSNDGRFYVF